MSNWRTAILAALVGAGVSAGTAHAQYEDMAVIKGRNGCGGLREYTIHIDNEDTNNANGRSGWLGGITSDRNTTLRLCAVDSSRFHPAAEPYMLVSLTSWCPRGTRVERHVDCENRDPRCSSNIPGVIKRTDTKDLVISFCLFKGGTGYDFPYIGLEYGVFAPSSFAGAIQSGYVFMDDQQASVFGENRNYWCDNDNTIYGDRGHDCSNYSDHRDYLGIIDGGHNTGMSLARVR